MTSWILCLALASDALAALPPPPPRPDLSPEASEPEPYWSLNPTVRVSLRVAGEFWQDPAVATVYRTGAIGYGAALGVEVIGPFGVEVEATYRRLKGLDLVGVAEDDDGNGYVFETVPVTALLTVTPLAGNAASAWVGVGPSWAVYSAREQVAAGEALLTMGVKAALEARVGLRLHSGLLIDSAVPTKGAPTAIEWELYAARRFQFSGDDGYDLSAWRISLGIGLSF